MKCLNCQVEVHHGIARGLVLDYILEHLFTFRQILSLAPGVVEHHQVIVDARVVWLVVQAKFQQVSRNFVVFFLLYLGYDGRSLQVAVGNSGEVFQGLLSGSAHL